MTIWPQEYHRLKKEIYYNWKDWKDRTKIEKYDPTTPKNITNSLYKNDLWQSQMCI